MSLEVFLARLYVDPRLRERFVGDPRGVAIEAGLSHEECDALVRIDQDGLALAAYSFARKRSSKARGAGKWRPTWRRWISRSA